MNLKIDKVEGGSDGTFRTMSLTVEDMEWGGEAEVYLRDICDVNGGVRGKSSTILTSWNGDSTILTSWDGEVAPVDYNGEVLE